MYSWKAIRTACLVLLLLPIVHVAWLMSRDTMEALDNSPTAWAREVANFTVANDGMQLSPKSIVVVGGLRVKLWRNLQDQLAPRPVLMRGIGDAIVEDITFNYTPLIGLNQPDTVVLLPGNSEFHIRDNKSAAELANAIRQLVELDASHGLTHHFYVFTPLKTLLYPEDHGKIDETTRLLQAWAKDSGRVAVLDPNPLLADAGGMPEGIYFRGDGVNLNEHGYLRLSVLLRSRLEKDAGEELQANSSAP